MISRVSIHRFIKDASVTLSRESDYRRSCVLDLIPHIIFIDIADDDLRYYGDERVVMNTMSLFQLKNTIRLRPI